MSHTAGPWHATIKTIGVDHPVYSESATLIALVESHKSEAIRDPERTEQAKANARLIAAAPDLLEALENLMRETDEGTNLCAREFSDAAKAAIAKAKGITA